VKINCLRCGHKVDLDDVYDDYEGAIKCLCGALLEIKTEEGRLKMVRLAPPTGTPPKSRSMPGVATT